MTGEAPSLLAAKVLTVSDGVVAGTREDRSGQALHDVLAAAGWTVVERRVVSDGADVVALNVSCIDGVELAKLAMTPIDGRNR